MALLQLFRPVEVERAWPEIEEWVRAFWDVDELVVWQRRTGRPPALLYRGRPERGPEPYWALEQGQRFAVSPHHRGQDPQLFLDLRVARRWLRSQSAGKSILNLFAYTCGAGLAAEAGGAETVVNVDFSRGALDWGRSNAEANGCERQEYLCEEFYPVAWQLAGRKLPGRAARRPTTLRLQPRTFDLIFLDPPARSKGFFGAVDVANDYPGLLRPCLEIAAAGGTIVACNNLGSISEAVFRDQLERAVRKSGRSLSDLRRWLPEEDFPSRDGDPPLKVMELRLV